MRIDTHVHFRLLDSRHQNWLRHPTLNAMAELGLQKVRHSFWGRTVDKVQQVMNLNDNYLAAPAQSKLGAPLYNTLAILNLPFYGMAGEDDLEQAMARNGFDRALVVAFSQFQDIDMTARIVADHPQYRWAATIEGKRSASLSDEVREYVDLGASAIYLHPINDKREPEWEGYEEIVTAAAAAGKPIILRTGLSRLPGQKDPTLCEVSRWRPLIERHRDARFTISHANMGDNEPAFELLREFDNLMIDTAWQNPGSVQKMVDRVGADRVMLASDWPIMGDPQAIQARIHDKLYASNADREKIGWKNAEAFYGFSGCQAPF